MERYKITYTFNTPLNYQVTQEKNLIPRSIYNESIKPKLMEIGELENELCSISKNNKRYKVIEFQIKSLKSTLKKQYGEYFTDQSTIWLSQYNNGIMYDYARNSILVKLEKS